MVEGNITNNKENNKHTKQIFDTKKIFCNTITNFNDYSEGLYKMVVDDDYMSNKFFKRWCLDILEKRNNINPIEGFSKDLFESTLYTKEYLTKNILGDDINIKKQFPSILRGVLEKSYNLACFTMDTFSNPLLWGFYTDNKGLCFEFEIDDNDDDFVQVSYIKSPQTISLTDVLLPALYDEPTNTDPKYLTFKYIDWRFENEIRYITDVDKKFTKELKLVRVILAPYMSEYNKEKLRKLYKDIVFIESELSHTEYKIIEKYP